MALPTIRIAIVLELSGDAATAFDVVNNVLDDGVFQDAINDYETDDGPIHVESALLEYGAAEGGPADPICGNCGKTVEHGRCRECGRETA